MAPGTMVTSTSWPLTIGSRAKVYAVPSSLGMPCTDPVAQSDLGLASHEPACTGVHADPLGQAAMDAISLPCSLATLSVSTGRASPCWRVNRTAAMAVAPSVSGEPAT